MGRRVPYPALDDVSEEPWISGLRRAIREHSPSDPSQEDFTRVPGFAALTDVEIHALLDLVIREGSERGFGSWWWE